MTVNMCRFLSLSKINPTVFRGLSVIVWGDLFLFEHSCEHVMNTSFAHLLLRVSQCSYEYSHCCKCFRLNQTACELDSNLLKWSVLCPICCCCFCATWCSSCAVFFLIFHHVWFHDSSMLQTTPVLFSGTSSCRDDSTSLRTGSVSIATSSAGKRWYCCTSVHSFWQYWVCVCK